MVPLRLAPLQSSKNFCQKGAEGQAAAPLPKRCSSFLYMVGSEKVKIQAIWNSGPDTAYGHWTIHCRKYYRAVLRDVALLNFEGASYRCKTCIDMCPRYKNQNTGLVGPRVPSKRKIGCPAPICNWGGIGKGCCTQNYMDKLPGLHWHLAFWELDGLPRQKTEADRRDSGNPLRLTNQQ